MLCVLAALTTTTALTTPHHNTPRGVAAAPLHAVRDRDHNPSPPYRQPQREDDTTSLLDSVGAMCQHLFSEAPTGLHLPDLHLSDLNQHRDGPLTYPTCSCCTTCLSCWPTY